MILPRSLAVFAFAALAGTASAGEISREDLKQALQKNPDVLIEALKASKKELFEVVQSAAQEAQARAQQEEQQREKNEFDEAFKKPFKPKIDAKTLSLGSKDAKYTLVEYSDFQCPFCSRGFQTVQSLKQKYGKDMRFVYKHLPLVRMHPEAMPAALLMEAAGLQSTAKAFKFHDALYQNQDKLGADFYKKAAADAGLDFAKMEKDAQSQAVKDAVEADINEAKEFGFSGTPAFLLNGVPIKGAYPVEYFDEIIKRLNSKS